MTLSIQLSDENAESLRRLAEAEGVSLQALIERLANQEAKAHRLADDEAEMRRRLDAVDRILEIQKRVKPDPEGWTIQDYVNSGRR